MSRLPLVLLLVVAVACGGGDGEGDEIDGVVDAGEESSQAGLPLPPGIGRDVVAPPAAPVPAPSALPVVAADHLAGFGDDLVRVYVLGVGDDYGDPAFLGVVVSCAPDSLEATVAHGRFPAPGGAPVRTVVEFPDGGGDPEVFGPLRSVTTGATGPHETVLSDRMEVERLVRSAFVSGAVVSNGHRSFRNALDADRNASVVGEILASCSV